MRLIEAVESDSRVYVPVSTYDPEFKTYIGYPAIVGRGGIGELIQLKLTSEEHDKLKFAADKIKEHLDSLK